MEGDQIARSGQTAKTPAASGPWDAAVFVWLVWAAMVVGSVAFVAQYISEVPTWDQWDVVPVLTGHQPLTLGWLWDWHNEHRIPLPKLVVVAWAWATHDLRPIAYFNLLLLALLAALLIWSVRRLSGRIDYADAFFPLALLHVGHYENFLSGFQFHFVGCVFLTGLVQVAIVARDARSRRPLLVGVCAILLPLFGAVGAVQVPALALWLLLCAREQQRAEGTGRRMMWPLLASGVSLGLAGLHFVGGPPLAARLGPIDPIGLVRTFIQFWVIGVGPAVAAWQTEAGWPMAALVLAPIIGTALLMARGTWSRRPSERLRTMGLLLHMVAVGCLAGAIAWGREGFGPSAGLVHRYTTLAVVGLCDLYLVAVIYDRGTIGRLMRMILFTLLVMLALPNLGVGLAGASARRTILDQIEQEICAGQLPEETARHYWRHLHPGTSEEYIRARLRMLQAARMGPYRQTPIKPERPGEPGRRGSP